VDSTTEVRGPFCVAETGIVSWLVKIGGTLDLESPGAKTRGSIDACWGSCCSRGTYRTWLLNAPIFYDAVLHVYDGG
jgi:hypothetical protein